MTIYFDRTDPTKEYESHKFVAGRGLQSAELNEIQTTSFNRIKAIADSLFKDGDVIRDAQCVVNATTGVVNCQSGAIYLRGAVRGVAPKTFTIPIVGTIAIGIRLIESFITANDDPTLLDPANGTRNYAKAGSDRLKVHAEWGFDGDSGTGEFYPVYTVVDGMQNAKEPPPNLDAFSQALARYDRDSAGGCYVVSGLQVTQLADNVDGTQAYTMSEGRARVYGNAIEFATARRIRFDTLPDLKQITNEPHLSTTASAQRVNFNRKPGGYITEVTITEEKTVTLVHGVSTGAQDPLPDTSILQILEVKQGGSTYTPVSDYNLTADKVDWSPAGSEPAPGSSYTVKYRYLKNVTPTLVDSTGFTVTGAVVGTLIQVSYSQKLPRIDRLCLTADGSTVWMKGISAEYNPQPPTVPVDMLALTSIYQTWDADRRTSNDGVRVVPMPVLAKIEGRIDKAMQLIAQGRLESTIHTREGGTKKGLFVDPFLDDSQRDAGTPQTAAIVGGELILPIAATVKQMGSDITTPTTLSYAISTTLSQPLKTGSMNINPYMAFGAVPAQVVLTPSVDRWTTVENNSINGITSRFIVGAGDQSSTETTVRNVLLSTASISIENLRSIEVSFSISGFDPSEVLETLTFDGQEVTPVPI